MTPEQLSQAILAITNNILAQRGDQSTTATLEDAAVERPRNKEHGDWASNVAMRFAKRIGANPREFATEIADALREVDGVASVDIAGPGFINIRLTAGAAGQVIREIVERGYEYGRNNSLSGRRINMEFVSANPTGPLHLGHTRWAALGDSLSRVLRAAGADLTAEYYINDAGSQMDKFGYSVLAAVRGEPTPEGGYPGEYIAELARQILAEIPEVVDLPEEEALVAVRERAYQLQMAEIKRSLEHFRVYFDVFFSERSLHETDPRAGRSPIEASVERLREQGHVYEEDGAVWVRTTDFTDDKDRVITRGNGVYTYFAADAAYYLSKKDRGFTEKIYLLGADHHGYVNRLKAIAGAAGEDPDTNIKVMIGQLVNLNGAKLSKRAGNIVELDDLLEWLGADALRYWLARYPADSPLSLEGEKLRSRSNENPVFYVQYAHARTSAVARNAAAAGVDTSVFAPDLLTHGTETDLIGALQEYPRVVGHSAELREPHRIARYLEDLAGYYHRWYDACRVTPLGDESVSPLHQTRLWLNNSVGIVIRNGLDLLGVEAPERM
ncbi:arginine--tRNA ligase [Lysinibacter sp. HNR]|uniref:arginine--tRNA ligase n=1 Tax=Lysinibacter sp. HNR TaxID=3031408 RepID=UPI0024350440|nr:arginine--tRNA ligase [Lysinibacter sp. HNR]WGD36858.1 arginine--tRNA ligase [Lysinibacter sp. HNR]